MSSTYSRYTTVPFDAEINFNVILVIFQQFLPAKYCSLVDYCMGLLKLVDDIENAEAKPVKCFMAICDKKALTSSNKKHRYLYQY